MPLPPPAPPAPAEKPPVETLEMFLIDFDYVCKRLPPPILCFGSTRLRFNYPRPEYPDALETASLDDFDALAAQEPSARLRVPHIHSRRGYGPLCSRRPRFGPAIVDRSRLKPVPPKPEHWHPIIEPVRRRRPPPFGRRLVDESNRREEPRPGPCTFTLDRKRVQRISGSFGGRRCLAAAVHTVCEPISQSVCQRCHVQQTERLFWLDRTKDAHCRRRMRVLCKDCMAVNKERVHDLSSIVKQRRVMDTLNQYRVSRWCSYMHAHHETTKAIPTISREALRCLYRTENYLAQFGM